MVIKMAFFSRWLHEEIHFLRVNKPGWRLFFRFVGIIKFIVSIAVVAAFSMGIWYILYGYQTTGKSVAESKWAAYRGSEQQESEQLMPGSLNRKLKGKVAEFDSTVAGKYPSHSTGGIKQPKLLSLARPGEIDRQRSSYNQSDPAEYHYEIAAVSVPTIASLTRKIMLTELHFVDRGDLGQTGTADQQKGGQAFFQAAISSRTISGN